MGRHRRLVWRVEDTAHHDSPARNTAACEECAGRRITSRDRADIAEAGDERAKLAQEIEAYRLKKYIGSYAAAMGGVDAIVFTAGAGELNNMLRERVISGLEFMGVELDAARNREGSSREKETVISTDSSKVKVMVIPTDEELVFVEDVAATLENRYDIHTKFTYSFQDPKFRRKIVHN